MATPTAAPSYGIPARVYAGATAVWLTRAPDTLPGDGWTVRVLVSGAETVAVTATPDGSAWRATLAAATTGGLPAGVYKVTAIALKGGEAVVIDRGTLSVVAIGAEGTDGRHPDEIALERAYAVREQLLADGLQEYTAGEGGAGRSVTRKTLDEIAREITRLERRIAARRNGGRGRPIVMRFG